MRSGSPPTRFAGPLAVGLVVAGALAVVLTGAGAAVPSESASDPAVHCGSAVPGDGADALSNGDGTTANASAAALQRRAAATAAVWTADVAVTQVQVQYLTGDRWIQYYRFDVERRAPRVQDHTDAPDGRIVGEDPATLAVLQVQCQVQRAPGTTQVQRQTLVAVANRSGFGATAAVDAPDGVETVRSAPERPAVQRQNRSASLAVRVGDRDLEVVVVPVTAQFQGRATGQVQRQGQHVAVRTASASAANRSATPAPAA